MDSPDRKNLHVLIACFLGMVFDGMDASIYVLTMHPCLKELLGPVSDTEIGVHGSLIMATFMFGWAAGAVIFGVMADRLGRTATLISTVVLYALFTGLCATSHSWQELALYRFVVGLGIGGEISIGGVMLAEAWKGNARLHATGILQSGFSIGYLVLGAVNLLVGSQGWRVLYLVGIVPALLALYMRFKLEDTEDARLVREHRRKIASMPGAELDDYQSRLLKLPLFELFSSENIKKVTVLVVLASTVCIGTYAVISWVPAWINQLTGTVAVEERSYAVISRNLGAILGAASGGFFILRFGRRWSFRIAFTGALICSLGMFLTTRAFGGGLLCWTFVEGFFVLAPYTYLFIYVPELFDTRLRATAFGFSIQCGRIFAGLASILGGQLVKLFGGSFAYAGACLSLIYLVGLLATVFMPDSTGQVREESRAEGG